MHVLGIDGSPAAVTATIERVIDALAGERVGVIRQGTESSSVSPDAYASIQLSPDGPWSATGQGMTCADALEALAPHCDWCLVGGAPVRRGATVVVGTEAHEEAIAAVETADELDPASLLAAVAETDEFETLASLVAEVKESPRADRAGAIATFTGRVRAKDDPKDPPTEYLEFEKYDGVADERLEALQGDLLGREGVHDVRLHHRTGVLERGEDIVFVVVLAGHRDEAFRTVRDGIDRLKEEVPLFKKEVTVDDAFWVHEDQ